MNGAKVFDGPRTNDNWLYNINTFVFPTSSAGGGMNRNGWGADWSLGEIIVVNGTHSEQHRMEIESYLGKKWGVPMNYGFVKRSDWVYEDRNFEQTIDFWRCCN